MRGLEDPFAQDRQIGQMWVALTKARGPVAVTTNKGIDILIETSANEGRRVEYRAYLKDHTEIAWMYTGVVTRGRVMVTNAGVDRDASKGKSEYRRKGIGTAVYNLIESDIRAAGGKGLEPNWAGMSDDAMDFWKDRRPDLAEKIAKYGPDDSPRMPFDEWMEDKG